MGDPLLEFILNGPGDEKAERLNMDPSFVRNLAAENKRLRAAVREAHTALSSPTNTARNAVIEAEAILRRAGAVLRRAVKKD